jgi:pimeloyl-ACP methyl ester carboxylesterase
VRARPYLRHLAAVVVVAALVVVLAGFGPRPVVDSAPKPAVDVMITPPAGMGSTIPPTLLPAYAQRPGERIDVGGGLHLNLYCFGSGSPSVLLEAGSTWGAVAWANLQKPLAGKFHTRVCSYDRAGMNFSDNELPGRKPKDDAGDLHALLTAAKIASPYVLVGWSHGGFIVRRYAYEHPKDVAAIVTIDGSTDDYPEKWGEGRPSREQIVAFFKKCIDAARAEKLDADPSLFKQCVQTVEPLDFVPEMHEALHDHILDPHAYERMLTEFLQLDAAAAELRAMRRSYGDLLLRVVVAGGHYGNHAADDAPLTDLEYLRHSFQVASLSSQGRMIVIPNTTHALHMERPDVVLDIIGDVIRQVRQDRPK